MKGASIVSDKAPFATWVQPASGRRLALLAAGLGLAFSVLAGTPTVAQSDPIDRSRELSKKPLPKLAAPEEPTERLVPESRRRDTGTNKDKVISPHYERATTGRPEPPPPVGWDLPGPKPARTP
jgi:hypothetical protein